MIVERAAAPDEPGNSRDQAPRKSFRLRFRLRTLLLAITAVAVWLGWNVHIVQRRNELRRTGADHGAHFVSYWEGAATAPKADKDRTAPTVMAYFDAQRKTSQSFGGSSVSIESPTASADLPLIRRWLGDEPVVWIVLTDPTQLPTYHASFPEAFIAVDPQAEGAIADWTRNINERPAAASTPSSKQPPSTN